MNTDDLTLDSTYDPKSDPAIRDRCTALGVLIDTLTPGYDPLRVAAQVERTAMEIAVLAVRQALLAHRGSAAPALGYWSSEAEALVAALEIGGGGA